MDENEGRDYRSVGEILREAREQRRWSLQEASARTRIPVRLVEAVEADDLEALSGPIYARGFVRSLGECYELDVEFLLTKLSAAGVADDPTQLKTPVPPVTPASMPSSGEGVARSGRSAQEDTTPVWTVESARVRKVAAPAGRRPGGFLLPVLGLLVVVGMGGLAWMQWGGGRGSGAATESSPGAFASATREVRDRVDSEPVVHADAAAGDAVESEPEAGEAAALPASAGAPEREAADGPTVESGERASGAAGPDTPEVAQVEPAEVADGVEVFDREALPAALESVEPGEPREVADLRLTLMASGPLVIRWSADSRDEQRLVLRAGESRELRAHDHFSLAVDDPSALRVLLGGRPYSLPRPWDGSEILIPVAPSGGR